MNADNEDQSGSVGTVFVKRPVPRPRIGKSTVDRKFETIMSLKRVAEVVIVFRTTHKVPSNVNTEDSEVALTRYLRNRVFGSLCYADKTDLFDDRIAHRLFIHQYCNVADGEVYFSLEITRTSKYDQILDRVFEAVYLFNRSLERVDHRLGACNVVYCSDTVYFMDISKRLFVDNSVTFVYCFLTDKYKPVIENREETDAFGLAKILSSVEYSTKCSLKRNHNSRAGHGPLTSVISEGGLNESVKFVNNLVRGQLFDSGLEDYITTGDVTLNPFTPSSPTYSPHSPTYPSAESPPTSPEALIVSERLDNVKGTVSNPDPPSEFAESSPHGIRRTYVINEPYVNAFLNRPVACANMY